MEESKKKNRVIILIVGSVTFLAALFGFLADGASVYDRFFSKKEHVDLSGKGILNTYETGDQIILTVISSKEKNYQEMVEVSRNIPNHYGYNSIVLYYTITPNLQDKFLFYFDIVNSTYLEREKFERKLTKEMEKGAFSNPNWCFNQLIDVVNNVFVRDLANTIAEIDIFLLSDFDLCDENKKEVEGLLHRLDFDNLFLIQTSGSINSYQGFFNDVSNNLGPQKKVYFSVGLPFIQD